MIRVASPFRGRNIVHAIPTPTRVLVAQEREAVATPNREYLDRVERELEQVQRIIARRAVQDRAPAAGISPGGEAEQIRSLRARIVTLERMLAAAPVAADVGPARRPAGQRIPRHRLVALPPVEVDPVEQERKDHMLAQLLAANLELRRQLALPGTGSRRALPG